MLKKRFKAGLQMLTTAMLAAAVWVSAAAASVQAFDGQNDMYYTWITEKYSEVKSSELAAEPAEGENPDKNGNPAVEDQAGEKSDIRVITVPWAAFTIEKDTDRKKLLQLVMQDVNEKKIVLTLEEKEHLVLLKARNEELCSVQMAFSPGETYTAVGTDLGLYLIWSSGSQLLPINTRRVDGTGLGYTRVNDEYVHLSCKEIQKKDAVFSAASAEGDLLEVTDGGLVVRVAEKEGTAAVEGEAEAAGDDHEAGEVNAEKTPDSTGADTAEDERDGAGQQVDAQGDVPDQKGVDDQNVNETPNQIMEDSENNKLETESTGDKREELRFIFRVTGIVLTLLVALTGTGLVTKLFLDHKRYKKSIGKPARSVVDDQLANVKPAHREALEPDKLEAMSKNLEECAEGYIPDSVVKEKQEDSHKPVSQQAEPQQFTPQQFNPQQKGLEVTCEKENEIPEMYRTADAFYRGAATSVTFSLDTDQIMDLMRKPPGTKADIRLCPDKNGAFVLEGDHVWISPNRLNSWHGSELKLDYIWYDASSIRYVFDIDKNGEEVRVTNGRLEIRRIQSARVQNVNGELIVVEKGRLFV